MLQGMSVLCTAHDLHTIASWPLECTCWRQFTAQWGGCNNISNCACQCNYYYHYHYHHLWERAGQEPVATQILQRKWGWIGHTLRKPVSSITLQALTWNPQGKRKRGRPRHRWRRDTEAQLKQQRTFWSGMARTAQNRVQWRGVVIGLCSVRSDGHK